MRSTREKTAATKRSRTFAFCSYLRYADERVVELKLQERVGKLPEEVLEHAADVMRRLRGKIDAIWVGIEHGAQLLNSVLDAVHAVNPLFSNQVQSRSITHNASILGFMIFPDFLLFRNFPEKNVTFRQTPGLQNVTEFRLKNLLKKGFH